MIVKITTEEGWARFKNHEQRKKHKKQRKAEEEQTRNGVSVLLCLSLKGVARTQAPGVYRWLGLVPA